MSKSFLVEGSKHFLVALNAVDGCYEACLYEVGNERVVARGKGTNHSEAMQDLVLEVGPRENERMKQNY